ncbi:hypothetical protein AB0G83_28075 [Streptomyces klenkii]|uniref:hypothetical protein n=1 Tax=Streptomyces klenkii TaxID=1420899 RepID=UPI0033D815D3
MTAAACALVGAVSEETLTAHGFTRRNDVHQAARCAELWVAENRRRSDREALARHQDQEATR